MAAPMSETNQGKVFPSNKGAAIIDGIHTDVICSSFADKLMIVLTQFQKLGTLVLVTRDEVMDESRGELVYTTKVLLGKDEPEHHVIARCLADKIPVRKPILFALGLKDTSPQMLKGLVQVMNDYKCW